MTPGAWILIYILATIVLGTVLGPVLRFRRNEQTTELPPPVHQVRDEQLDISDALRRHHR